MVQPLKAQYNMKLHLSQNLYYLKQFLENLTPADVYFGRSEQILEKRRQIKSDSFRKRRQLYFQQKLLNL